MWNKYRTNQKELESILQNWAVFIKKHTRLVACGGTALTLLELQDSTRDVDFLVPEDAEYKQLLSVLENIGYVSVTGTGWAHPRDGLKFDLFPGHTVFVTELLESPLCNNNSILWEVFGKIEVRILNPYDIIITKMFRGDTADIHDSIMLLQNVSGKLDAVKLFDRYKETASYYISGTEAMRNLENLIEHVKDLEPKFNNFVEVYRKWTKNTIQH